MKKDINVLKIILLCILSVSYCTYSMELPSIYNEIVEDSGLIGPFLGFLLSEDMSALDVHEPVLLPQGFDLESSEQSEIPLKKYSYLPECTTRKEEKKYSVSCYVDDCKKNIFIRRSKGSLLIPLISHIYSRQHKHDLHKDMKKYLDNAVQKQGRVLLECPFSCPQILQASSLPKLKSQLIIHRYATKIHNNDEYEKIKQYIKEKAITTYE